MMMGTPVSPMVVDAGSSSSEGSTMMAANQTSVSPTTMHEAPAAAEAASLVPAEPLPEAPADLAYVIVNEAGASVYSASPVGREEFPNFDATLRGTISIGRRLQDPLSELVKIDPQNIGVGLYQHDVNPKQLKESLEAVIESCVNTVGVDLNTASVPLLRHVSGLNQLAARSVVEFRQHNGPFKRRDQLLQVPNIGEARYVQAAGFLKITGGDNPLDSTWIHPESYAAAGQLLSDLGYGPEALADRPKIEELNEKLKTLSPEEVAARLQIGVLTLRDILDSLSRPGRDPREDLPPPIFRKGILKLEDLQPGMELKGTVLNVVDFGAFVDIGLKDSGLVHISQMANRYIKNPYEVAAVGDVVSVWVLTVDKDRRRVSLTMIKPGTERKPPERKPLPPRREEGERRPQGGRRPAGGQQARGRPPGPPRQQPGQAPQQPVAASAEPPSAPAPKGAATTRSSQPPARPTPPPRRPQRPKPKANLSQAALEGEAPLRTFSELLAFYEAQKSPPPPQPVSEPETAAAAASGETPPGT
ncbi:MAG: helix-hairpin-helix domain-containing protein [Gemmataceae bacterium]